MKILITNDDGFRAPGIIRLARAVRDRGYHPIIAAPTTNMSGMSAALGSVRLDQRIDVELATLEGIPAYGIDGPPALAVLAAHLCSFGHRPDAVVSGINAGLNTGASILHSGTVGAALTAASFGYRSIAVSVAEGDPWRFDTAAAVACEWLDWLFTSAAGTIVNLNVPDRGLEEVAGTSWAHLDPLGAVQVASGESTDGRLQLELRPRASDPPPPGSDTALVAAGHVTATLLRSVSERASTDLEVPARLDAGVTIRANDAPTNIGAPVPRQEIDIPQLVGS